MSLIIPTPPSGSSPFPTILAKAVDLVGKVVQIDQGAQWSVRDLLGNIIPMPATGSPIDLLDVQVGSNGVSAVGIKPTPESPFMWISVLQPQILADVNHDLVISANESSSSDSPFRIWANLDNDWGDTGGVDFRVPLGPNDEFDAQDEGLFGTGSVDGRRDLVDWFPLFIDMKQQLNTLDPAHTEVYLSHKDEALNFIYTNLPKTSSMAHLKALQQTGYGDNFNKSPEDAKTRKIKASGVEFSSSFLDSVRAGDAGLLLVEGRNVTTEPLILNIKEHGVTIYRAELQLRVNYVEDMFRHINMTDATADYGSSSSHSQDATALPTRTGDPGDPWPDSVTNGKYFVFLHGYNVNGEKAKGWHSEIFKRLHQAGNNARFVGITWNGDTGTSYHKGVFHAFQTGDKLKAALETVTGVGTDVTIAAHSLGNVVVSHAIQNGYNPNRYFMINGAVAIEAFDPIAPDDEMWESSWRPVDPQNIPLLAAYWHEKFSGNPGDVRNSLKWRGRFSSVVDRIFNFYSEGEDVVENSLSSSASVWQQILTDFSIDRGAWKAQELVKGTTYLASLAMSRRQGGWGLNPNYSTPAQIDTDPYFKPFLEASLIHQTTTVTSLESEVVYDVLARGVPAMTFATAANRIPLLEATNRNFDMEANGVGRNGTIWPSEGHNSPASQGKWLHSDLKNVAAPYVYPLYEKFVQLGGLQ